MTIRQLGVLAVAILLSAVAVAVGTYSDFLHDLAVRESSLNPTAINPYGYVGLFQFGEAALQDAGYYSGDTTRANDWAGTWTGAGGVTSMSAFLSSPDAQVQAAVAYQNQIQTWIHNLGLDSAIGSTINGIPITQSGLIAGAWLVGIGNLQRFINSNGAIVPTDGNGTPITSYISHFGGYSLGGPPPTGATVLAASGGGGFGAPPPPPPTAATVAGAPAPTPLSPTSSFAVASGQSLANVRLGLTSIVATFMMVWFAWTVASHYGSWRQNQLSFITMQGDIVRAAMMVGIMVVILS